MMSKLHPIFEIARTTAWIQVCKPLMFALGNDEAIIFGELLSRNNHFSREDKLTKDGYFYNTMWDLASGTNLNDHRQRLAINNLVAIGLIKTRVKDVPPKRYFKIMNDPDLLAMIIDFGTQKARRIKEDANSQIFKELIFNHVKNPYSSNKPNGTGGGDAIDPEQVAVMRAAYLLKEQENRDKYANMDVNEYDG